MSKIYFIGDTHFGHNGISEKFRTGFSSDEEHHGTIHENILQCSGKRNVLFLLGDITFKVDQFPKIKQYSDSFQAVHMILGNHDHHSLPKFCVDNGVHVHGFLKKYGMWLSHCPIHPQELYRGNNIHGHVHSNTVPDQRYFNVSCENIEYKPITLQEIREVFYNE